MNIDSLIKSPAKGSSLENSPGVMTSRIRLARNLSGVPFPGWATKKKRLTTFETLSKGLSFHPLIKKGFFSELSELSSLEKQLLIEQHLMSRELGARSGGCGVAVNREKTISIMLNEEDHLRLQAIQPGLNLKKAYNSLNNLDETLGSKLSIAYDEKLGFLTSCPTNVGTGLRASVMLHLPALALTEQIQQVLKAVSKLGLAIRGLYGEGTESVGHLYQISNQSTLGESEREIIIRIERVVKQVLLTETNARAKMLADNPMVLLNRIGIAYGTLKHSFIMSSKEALNLLSLIRLGTEVSFFPPETLALCDQLIINSQPAHLQYLAGKKLDIEKRDLFRAKILSSHLQTLNPPHSKDITPSEDEPTEGDSLLTDHE